MTKFLSSISAQVPTTELETIGTSLFIRNNVDAILTFVRLLYGTTEVGKVDE